LSNYEEAEKAEKEKQAASSGTHRSSNASTMGSKVELLRESNKSQKVTRSSLMVKTDNRVETSNPLANLSIPSSEASLEEDEEARLAQIAMESDLLGHTAKRSKETIMYVQRNLLMSIYTLRICFTSFFFFAGSKSVFRIYKQFPLPRDLI
jgi:hypothetical protein